MLLLSKVYNIVHCLGLKSTANEPNAECVAQARVGWPNSDSSPHRTGKGKPPPRTRHRNLIDMLDAQKRLEKHLDQSTVEYSTINLCQFVSYMATTKHNEGSGTFNSRGKALFIPK